ncbi:MAG: purine-nucleoside phosphorylase, partial [Gemmatimonadetes bacterium]|nr:purine-nucleoside phosphorylase [Gemmatimonadota bacterium]
METALSSRLKDTVAFLRERGVGEPEAAFVLGSGLSGILEPENSVSVPFAEIPGFPQGTLAGHDRRLEFGTVDGHAVLVLHGRAHFYEGTDLQ